MERLPTFEQFMQSEHFDSENLLREFLVLEDTDKRKVISGIDWLQEKGIDAVLVGGTAVAHHLPSSRKLTPDVDFLVDDLEKVKKKLQDDDISFKLLSYGLGITVDEFDMDLLDVKSGNRRVKMYAFKDSDLYKIAGRDVRIASPESLVVMKFDSGRDKDDKDAMLMLQSGVVSKERYEKVVNDLKGYVDDIIGAYVDIIPS